MDMYQEIYSKSFHSFLYVYNRG